MLVCVVVCVEVMFCVVVLIDGVCVVMYLCV